jgi:hypothetical protein
MVATAPAAAKTAGGVHRRERLFATEDTEDHKRTMVITLIFSVISVLSVVQNAALP